MRLGPDDLPVVSTGDGVSRRATTSVRGVHVAIAAAAYLVAPYAGFDGFLDPRISEVWPVGGVGVVLVMTLRGAPRSWLALTLLAMAALTTATGLGLGYAVTEATWIGVTAALQPALMAVLLRRWLSGPGWRPTRQRDIGVYLLATLVSTGAVGLALGYPGLGIDDLTSPLLGWWVLRSAVFCFVGAVLFAVLFAPGREEVLRPAPRWNTALLLAVGLTCVVGAYHDPTLPLSWLLLVPSVWAGLTLTVRGTAGASLAVALMAAAMTYVPDVRFGYDGPLPAASIVDLLVMASTGFALLLALLREQRASLIGELGRRSRDSDRQRELLRTVLDTMTEGVLVVGRSGLRTHNAAARQLLGGPLPRDPAASWSGLFGVADARGRPLAEERLRDLLRHPDEGPTELQLVRGREARVVEVTVTRLAHELDDGEDERPRAVLLRDTTDEQQRLLELREFAGRVAHDLRGPLTALDGWVELARDAEDPVDAAAALQRAGEASLRLRQVIEDWLAYAVVQQGRARPQPVTLAAAAHAVLEARAGEADVRLDLPHVVHADPALLRQLLDNLVDNAVKYTEPDRRPVVTLASYDDDEPGWVRVEVSDEGIGVPEGHEEAIFEDFHRGPGAGRYRGTGLGLSLARHIVTTHGGRIRARRNDGVGSTFVLTLPGGRPD